MATLDIQEIRLGVRVDLLVSWIGSTIRKIPLENSNSNASK